VANPRSYGLTWVGIHSRPRSIPKSTPSASLADPYASRGVRHSSRPTTNFVSHSGILSYALDSKDQCTCRVAIASASVYSDSFCRMDSVNRVCFW